MRDAFTLSKALKHNGKILQVRKPYLNRYPSIPKRKPSSFSNVSCSSKFFSFRILISLLLTGNQEEQSFSPDILIMNFLDTIISVMVVQATVPATLGLAVLVAA